MLFDQNLVLIKTLYLLLICNPIAQAGGFDSSNSEIENHQEAQIISESAVDQFDPENLVQKSKASVTIFDDSQLLKNIDINSLIKVETRQILLGEHSISLKIFPPKINTVKIELSSTFDSKNAKMSKLHSHPCLVFNFYPKTKTGYVAKIASNPHCQGNMNGLPVSGNNILRIVDQICEDLDIRLYDISDESELQCKDQPLSISLKWLHLFERGTTWYESKGYLPTDDYKEYRYSVEFLRTIPIKNLIESLSTHSIFEPSNSLLFEPRMGFDAEVLKVIRRFEDSASSYTVLDPMITLNLEAAEFKLLNPNGTLSEFMISLWKSEKCQEFNESLAALKYAPASALVRFIDFRSTHLLKRR